MISQTSKLASNCYKANRLFIFMNKMSLSDFLIVSKEVHAE